MKHMTTPLTLEQVQELKAGDQILLSGVIYTAEMRLISVWLH